MNNYELQAEVDDFVKHVGAPSFKEAVDVLLRTKQQDEDKISEMFEIIKSTGVTNSKLAAEIAELKAQKRPFSDKLADEVIKGQVKRITELETSLASLRVELEAVNTRYSELAAKRAKTDQLYQLALNNQEDLGKRLEAARKERDQWREQHYTADRSHFRVLQQRDTALAAKDAAEKRVAKLEADAEHFHEVRDEFRDKLEMLRDELRVTRKSRDEAIASRGKACLEASETIAILESRIKELETLIKEGKRTKDRVVELEASLDELSSVVGLTAFKHEGQRAVLQEAFDNARALLANRPSSP